MWTLSNLLDLLFPPQCLNCDTIVPTHGTLCMGCWQKIQFISDPVCAACGLPFDYDIGSHALCGQCLHVRPSYTHARAVFRYDEHSHKLITRFKYSDQTGFAKTYGVWLAKAGTDLLKQTDIIIPVPMHYFRFVRRHFNQSALLAQELARKTGIDYIPDALWRHKYTIPQLGLSKKGRKDNVKGAFSINRRYAETIKNKNILLVDDVMTTGSTIEQCAKTLLKSDAMRVNILTLARTVR